MDLAGRIKEERERLGYSQTAFAALAEASKHSQINWEKGAASPNAATLAAWAAVGLDVLFVVTGQRSQPVPPTAALPPRVRALIDNYEHTNEEGKRYIERAANLEAQSTAIGRKRAARGGE